MEEYDLLDLANKIDIYALQFAFGPWMNSKKDGIIISYQ